MEVVRGDAASRVRDYEDNRRDYAEARIPEYWIIDLAERRVVVFGLQGDKYVVASEFGAGDAVESQAQKGIRVGVARLLQAGQE